MSVLLLSCTARAFDAGFDVQPRVLRLGEAAICTFTVMGINDPPPLQFPPIDGVQIAQAGTQRSLSFGSGGGSSSVAYRYQLLPTKTGKIAIGPFTYSAEGQTLAIPAVEIEVVAPDGDTSPDKQAQQVSEFLFARIDLAQTNVYNQQLFDVTFSIYSRGLNMARDIGLQNMPPSGLGIGSFHEVQAGREVVDNQVYDVRRFRTKAQALGSGIFKLEPVLQVHLVVPRERRKSRDPFGMFDESIFDNPFFGNVQTQPVNVKPDPVDIHARPLPTQGQPPGFAGAVGQFTFDVQAKPLDLNVGDPITLTMQIAGNGNIDAIGAPVFAGGESFKVYESKLLGKEGDESSGRKVFEQVVIPKADTIKEFPPLTFSYFDPAREQYQTITRGPFPLNVHPSANGNAQMMQASADILQPQTQVLGADIVYLKPTPARWTKTNSLSWFLQPGFLAVQALPALLATALFFIVRRRDELTVNVAKARRQKAPRSAQAAVKKAELALAQGQRKAFFEALWEAMASYFGHRLNLLPGAVSIESIGAAMTRGRLDPAKIAILRELFMRCEQERFGAGAANMSISEEEKSELSRQLDLLNETLKSCERVRI
ncbi:MAG: hypothetical protein A2X46_11055 [Lentisphaerae bacterium GWF2_57_35]|nr:MAG: hypothetical protein A2X46_11055 [Lentisphaerae bacterium GWF2_57_35]